MIIAIGALCASACALPGSILVLRRMSLMGDAISHTVLPGIAIAFLITGSRDPAAMLIGAVVVGIITAFLVQAIQSFGNVEIGANDAVRMVIDDDSRISLSNNDSGTSNTIFGKSAGLSLDAGSNYNVFIGEIVSDATMNDATYNVGIGYSALTSLTTGDTNTCIGSWSGQLLKRIIC